MWRVVDKLDAVRGVDVTIRNYSVTADRVLEEFAAWLGVPDDVLVRPPMVRVNRSLSAAELVLQRAVNAELGPSGRILSDALCEQLPDVEPVSPRPSDAAQHELWERVLPAVRRINERVEEPHRYRFDHMPPVEGADEYTMSAEQLELIGRMLGSALAAERAVTADDVTAEDVGTADGPAARSRVAERIASIESRMRALGRRR